MEVTGLNFEEVFPVVSKAIKDASFLAIDAEFSGLTIRKTEHELDTCSERYRKLCNGVKDFTILQFGICTFTWDEKQGNYIARPFNFYVFPRPYNKLMPDMRFFSQSSSLHFLSTQGFDFNKWVYHGIPFLLPSSEAKLRKVLDSQQGKQQNNDSSTPNSHKVSIPPEHELYIKGVLEKVDVFVENSDEKSLSLPPSTPFVRRLVYNSVYTAHSKGLHLESKVNDEHKKHIVITKVTEAEKKSLQDQKIEQEDEEIEMATGFSRIIRLISMSGKVIIGHNMFLDLLHTIHLFISELPNNLENFKALLKSTFPKLVDTKVMATTAPLQEHFQLTHLNEVFTQISKPPFEQPKVVFPDEFDHYSTDTKLHEAGYDAYMTGVSFIGMVKYLEAVREGQPVETELDLKIIKPFLNKIFLFPRIEGTPYLNLDGEDIIPSRDHVFYMEFPSFWQISRIQTLFKDFGHVYVTWLDSISAFVSVAKKERAKKVLQNLDVDNVDYRIMSYAEYYETIEDEAQVEGANQSCNYSMNRSYDTTRQQTPPNGKTPTMQQETPAIKQQHTPSCSKQEQESTKLPENAAVAEMEEGELPDSPEPPAKRMKGQHIHFDEPDDW